MMNKMAKECKVELLLLPHPLKDSILCKIIQYSLSPPLTRHWVLLSLLACFQLFFFLLRAEPLHLAVKALRSGIFLLSLLINAGASSLNGLSVGSKNVDCTIK